jgi:hypothetical protein
MPRGHMLVVCRRGDVSVARARFTAEPEPSAPELAHVPVVVRVRSPSDCDPAPCRRRVPSSNSSRSLFPSDHGLFSGQLQSCFDRGVSYPGCARLADGYTDVYGRDDRRRRRERTLRQ